MELKKYQREVLSDLSEYITYVRDENNLAKSYRHFWEKKGVSIDIEGGYLRPYDNSVKGVPNVTVKVPTAGGKTFIACNALKTIFDKLPAEKPKVVAWFVPSDAILKQTYNKLSDPNDPYSQCLDSLFNGAVRVVDKESALNGTGISPAQISEQLTVFVLSVQSFASKSKEGRRVYRENERLVEYEKLYNSLTKRIEGADETSFIQVLSHLNPVVIIDESHNFEADLRVEMLNDINARFILCLTATPRKKSNIVSFVDAIKLKKENMVKLPVIVYNHKSVNDVISKSINLRNSLEYKAKEQEAQGGMYIRPIVLFQAQPKKDEDSETFSRIKQKLVESGIPEKQIKIKTAQIDEIKNINLMSRSCPVRYIITINALKEGWDCPFAYILASLANKTSRVDVEQILGRILRLPYTHKNAPNLLNLAYVFTSSDNFNDTIQAIVKGLNKAGYSKRDFKTADPIANTDTPVEGTPMGLFAPIEPGHTLEDIEPQSSENVEINVKLEGYNKGEETTDDGIDVSELKGGINPANGSDRSTQDIEKAAEQEADKFEQGMAEEEGNEDDIPNDVKDMQSYYSIKASMQSLANEIVLPSFVRRIATSSIFDPDGDEKVLVNKNMLAEGFDLSRADKNISFTWTEAQAQRIDLSESDEYTPKAFNIDKADLEVFRSQFRSKSTSGKVNTLVSRIIDSLKYNEIPESDIREYVKDVVGRLDDEKLSELNENYLQAQEKFKNHIDRLLLDYEIAEFRKQLDTNGITCEPRYKFPNRLTYKKIAYGLTKGLYSEEDGDINGFEYNVIREVANVENVVFWHRNPERGNGFGINGFINHYPDFIIRLKSGRIVLLETKGDDRDNSDSRNKLSLGMTWANKAGDNYRYYMVFDKANMDGALNVQEFIERLKGL